MAENLDIRETVPVNARRIYEAWLDSREHTQFTGSEAWVEGFIGGRFRVWDGYIQGKTLALEPYCRIVQSWRTLDFMDYDPDSRVEILLLEKERGTEVRLIHTGIPEGQSQEYKKGWVNFYLKPMKDYFENGY